MSADKNRSGKNKGGASQRKKNLPSTKNNSLVTVNPTNSISSELLSYLYNPKGNSAILIESKENLLELQKLYSSETMISFIGAGVSRPLGICDWTNLMEKLLKEAIKMGFDKQDNIGNPREYPELAQKIFEHFKSQGKGDDYFGSIINEMYPRYNSSSLTLLKLVLALKTHLTTNFDKALENAYRFFNDLSRLYNIPNLNFKYKPCSLPYFSGRDESNHSIYYLHGNMDGIFVLKENEYKTFYPSISGAANTSSLESLLEEKYTRNNIIFLGFSFDDVYIERFLRKLADELKATNEKVRELYEEHHMENTDNIRIKHFIVIDSEKIEGISWGNFISRFKSMHIYPIIYDKGQHIFLEELFGVLSEGNLHEKN